MPQRKPEGSGPVNPVGVVSSRGIRRREAGVPPRAVPSFAPRRAYSRVGGERGGE
jgi:hypothetical protein